MNDFKTFSLNPAVVTGVIEAGYVTPTPIQAQAIPPTMQGRDVMGLAQTGTGKTAAFVLPILHRLMQGGRSHVRALIIAPTRELAEQIHQATKILGRQTRLRSTAVYGGVNINPQIQKLKHSTEIVVACPGRLMDLITRGAIDLTRLEVLVLDEADHMFDMGFLPDIRRILKHLPSKRQTLLFSATMPEEIRRLAHDALNCPVTVQVDNTTSAATVSHALYPVKQHLKTSLLLELLHHTDTKSVLIFTRTKLRAKCLGERLKKADYRATTLQGNLSQQQRQAALGGFRDGTFQILVATDIAARGIDVSQISHVINFDIPNTPLAYVHRIGRTGRAARSGDAFTLVTADDKATVLGVEQVLGSPIERRILEDFNYSAPAPKKTSTCDNPQRQQMPRRKVDGSQKRGTKARSVSLKGSSKATAHGRTKQRSGRPDHTTKGPSPSFKRARRTR